MGYLSHVGAACCAQAAPAFLFPVILAIWSIFLYPVLTLQMNGGKSDALSFEASVCAGHGCACRRVMVSCVRCRPLQRYPLYPRRHSRLLRSVHHLRGFRQLRRGAAGDRVSHKPLRASHAGDMAVSKAPRPALRDSGQDLRVASFLETRKTF